MSSRYDESQTGEDRSSVYSQTPSYALPRRRRERYRHPEPYLQEEYRTPTQIWAAEHARSVDEEVSPSPRQGYSGNPDGFLGHDEWRADRAQSSRGSTRDERPRSKDGFDNNWRPDAQFGRVVPRASSNFVGSAASVSTHRPRIHVQGNEMIPIPIPRPTSSYGPSQSGHKYAAEYNTPGSRDYEPSVQSSRASQAIFRAQSHQPQGFGVGASFSGGSSNVGPLKRPGRRSQGLSERSVFLPLDVVIEVILIPAIVKKWIDTLLLSTALLLRLEDSLSFPRPVSLTVKYPSRGVTLWKTHMATKLRGRRSISWNAGFGRDWVYRYHKGRMRG